MVCLVIYGTVLCVLCCAIYSGLPAVTVVSLDITLQPWLALIIANNCLGPSFATRELPSGLIPVICQIATSRSFIKDSVTCSDFLIVSCLFLHRHPYRPSTSPGTPLMYTDKLCSPLLVALTVYSRLAHGYQAPSRGLLTRRDGDGNTTTTTPSQSSSQVLTPEIDSFIADILQQWNSPGGLSVAVVRQNEDGNGTANGWQIETKGYGIAREDGTKVDERTLFAVGSNSKVCTLSSRSLSDVFAVIHEANGNSIFVLVTSPSLL
jgi:hypothetical protein